MSTNHTPNYKLCQWEASDRVLRTDFNADNAKLETALTRIERTANRADTAVSRAYNQQNPGFVTGTYRGTTASGTNGSQKITLGFRPRAVLVCPSNGGLVLSISGVMYTYSGLVLDGQTASFLQIDDTGFTACNASQTGEASVRHNLNDIKLTFFYIALR